MAEKQIDHFALDDAVAAEIDALSLEPARPLIITDADEVLIRFVEGLEDYLETEGLWLDLTSFALTGNIKDKATNRPHPREDVPALLERFYEARAGDLSAVEGAAEALEGLAARGQIVVLSNVPRAQRAARQRNLAAQGFPYPLVAGKGLKGGAVKRLADKVEAPVFFLDDIPWNLASVAATRPDATLIHFVADRRLAKLIEPAEASHHWATDWRDARAFIEKSLSAQGF